ncbi:MAG: hypothetical protein WDM85_18570 [Caulobacteraceae bacterium]
MRARPKTGFSVPTGNWIAQGAAPGGMTHKGLASRGWSRLVLDGPQSLMAHAA